MRISLKAARHNKNLTQQEAADELKVSKKTVGSWESGKTVPTADKIEMICELYGVSYDNIEWRS